MKNDSVIPKLIALVVYAIFIIPFVFFLETIASIISYIGFGTDMSYVIAFILCITIISLIPKLVKRVVNLYHLKTHKNPTLKEQRPPLKKS